MKRLFPLFCFSFATFFSFAQGIPTNGVLASLCAPFQAIQTLKTEVRRTTTTPDDQIHSMLSSVVFARPDRFCAETFFPMHRKVVSDGSTLRMYIKGHSRGAEVSITNLIARKDYVMLSSFRAIPASPMDMLLVGEDAKEFLLPKSSEKTTMFGILLPSGYAELSVDERKRVTTISVFDSSEKIQENLRIEYSNFQEVLPQVWLALTHKTIADVGAPKKATMISRFVNLVVNKPVDEAQFAFDSFFDGVHFEPLYP